ncbi:unnamed protein product [Orchesella dallaii]|uniref:Ionotropic glutamate receptor C-terminal domain-containing protein n=1 Tax=Orchesella dallaii TaxID=48710 RepID=A0ABP1S1S2_9HEXA
MTSLILGAKHNMTILLYTTEYENRKKFQTSHAFQGPETILLGNTIIFTDIREYYLVSQLLFDRFSSKAIVYCHKARSQSLQLLTFITWYEPFSPGIWICVVFLLSVGLVYCFKHKKLESVIGEVVTHLASVFGASVKPRHLVIIYSISFMMSQLYSNGFTSIITVAVKPKGFMNTLKEFVDHGYKILHPSTGFTTKVEEIYGQEFADYGVSVSEAIQLSKYDEEDELKLMAQPDSRFGLMLQPLFATYFRGYASKFLKKNLNKTFNFFQLDQTINRKLIYWNMKTENQYWLKISMQQLFAFGLYYKWDEWAEWNLILRNKYYNPNGSNGPDTVELTKIVALMLMLSCLISVSLVVFCIEINFVKMTYVRINLLRFCIMRWFNNFNKFYVRCGKITLLLCNLIT